MGYFRCRSICERFALKTEWLGKEVFRSRLLKKNIGKHKRCGTCEIVFDNSYIYCPCCGSKLNSKPHGGNSQYKTNYEYARI